MNRVEIAFDFSPHNGFPIAQTYSAMKFITVYQRKWTISPVCARAPPLTDRHHVKCVRRKSGRRMLLLSFAKQNM